MDVFGFVAGGGTEMFKGWLTAKVQGVPGANTTCWWLLDRQDYFQLEFFQYHHPRARPLATDWSPADIGYTMIGIHVRDFDATLERAALHGTRALGEPLGASGRRRVCVRDPDGVLIEIMEEDLRAPVPRARPRGGLPCAVRFVTASVPDLEKARHFFVRGLGLQEAHGIALHAPEHESLWGLEGAQRSELLLWAGDMLVELVEYTRPRGRSWPENYYVSDLGLLNIAFGFRSRRELNRALAGATAVGALANFPVLEMGNWGVVYVNDSEGFSVELLYVRRWWDRFMGFAPGAPDLEIERRVLVDAAPRQVWERLVDHRRMSDWWPCESTRLVREGVAGNGPGALREILDRRGRLVEEVVGWEEEKRLDYRLRSGAPIRNHFGRVRLEARGADCTALRYTIRFTPAIPFTGWILRRVIGAMLDRGLANLQRLMRAPGAANEETRS
jgi:catechol 2,3-dioxygenase-like lactoylglutathione lyase family enzyme